MEKMVKKYIKWDKISAPNNGLIFNTRTLMERRPGSTDKTRLYVNQGEHNTRPRPKHGRDLATTKVETPMTCANQVWRIRHPHISEISAKVFSMQQQCPLFRHRRKMVSVSFGLTTVQHDSNRQTSKTYSSNCSPNFPRGSENHHCGNTISLAHNKTQTASILLCNNHSLWVRKIKMQSWGSLDQCLVIHLKREVNDLF